MENNNTNLFSWRGYICRKDFIYASVIVFIIQGFAVYLLYLLTQSYTVPVAILAALLILLMLYLRFCAFAKRLLDIEGQKYNISLTDT